MIRSTVSDRIATIALHRPEARNAIPTAQWTALGEAIAAVAAAGDVRALILRSDVPGIFSAGADIAEFESLQADPVQRTRFRLAMRGAIEALAAAPFPTIAAIDGGCFGAGVALVLGADIRIAGQDAVFATTPAKLGIAYPREDVARLSAQVGRGQAARMLFGAGTLSAAEAARIGLVEILAPVAADAAVQLAASIAANAPGAVAELKRILTDPSGAHDAAFDRAFGGPEFAEGLAAFRGRRLPAY
jgi:enoyl-CoA hydratase